MTGMRAEVASRRAQARTPSAAKACQKRQGVQRRKQRIMQVEAGSRLGITEGLAIASPAFAAFDGSTEYREHSAAPPAVTGVSP